MKSPMTAPSTRATASVPNSARKATPRRRARFRSDGTAAVETVRTAGQR
jgi:hypothetical protein